MIDELGRGTSTSDGFGIAWAVADRLTSSGEFHFLHEYFCLQLSCYCHLMHVLMKRSIDLLAWTDCLCFFATHFHELTVLEQDKKGKGVQNLHVMAEADSESNKLTMLYKARSPHHTITILYSDKLPLPWTTSRDGSNWMSDQSCVFGPGNAGLLRSKLWDSRCSDCQLSCKCYSRG